MKHSMYLSAILAGIVLLGGACVRKKAAASAPGKPEAQEAPPPAVPNTSFEEAREGKPTEWATHSWGGRATFRYAEIGRTGDRSVMIESTEGADSAWHQTVPVTLHSTYRLSGWIKTENVALLPGRSARGALLNIHNLQPTATKALTGTRDWTRVEVTFETGTTDSIQINCLLGGWGLATGKAWYDDLKLERLSQKKWNPVVTIDATRRGAPISKYIYGQFIEHLGRCIYGGIWAEMLEDRKFWFPITAKYDPYRATRNVSKESPFAVVGASPWEIVGKPGTVEMVKQDSFVGDHTPRLSAGGAIRQNDLGLLKGKAYAGYVWLRADGGAPAVTVTLRGAKGEKTIKDIGNAYARHTFTFAAAESTDKGSLTIAVDGGRCLIGTVSLMPGDNVDGMRNDTLTLLKELDSPVYRWPGGNFVSGYNWKDGIGDRDRRPPRKNPAWTGVEHNDFGIDEFMVFCRRLGTEPYIAVNSGLGGVQSAVEELQYCNGAADTSMGGRRARNGHPEPYRVKWWGIGNEMYGGWQLGHMSLEKYIKKHNTFAEAMRKEDPSIKLVAVGATGRWSEGMMQHCADHMDLISEHFYQRSKEGLAAHVMQISDAVRAKAAAHRDYRRRFDSLKGRDIDIALDEWNYWYGPHEFGELGTRYFLKDGLGVAAGIHEYARQSDIMFMANYAQTVNVIGCIKTSKTAAAFETTGLALKLYRRHYGTIPLAVEHPLSLDVAAALSDDGTRLTIGIVNPTMNAMEPPLSIGGLKITGAGRRYQIAGPDPMAHNDPGRPPKVMIEEKNIDGITDKLPITPCSVTLYVLKVR